MVMLQYPRILLEKGAVDSCLFFSSVLLVNLQRFTVQKKDKDEGNRIKMNSKIIVDFLRQPF